MIEIKTIIGTAIPLTGDNINTDRIMPARYLKEITFNDMDKYVFFDERFDKNGKEKKHQFNDKKFAGANILIVNKNFGCGSSREHAVQGIKRFGINAIIGESFSHIFAENCTKLGIPCVIVNANSVAKLMKFVQDNSQIKVNISLETKKISFGNERVDFEIPDAMRLSFINGTWNITELMRTNVDIVKEKIKSISYLNGFVR